MKYYAVTEDPNELLHYGRLGMKWGQHIYGGEKSAAYKRASAKLKKTSNKISASLKNGIARTKANWKKAHSPAALRKKAAKKEAKFMLKATQKAREGRLRYGKLTDDQVRRVTERLQLEQKARQLGSTEKSKFRIRMKDAIQEGMLQGATKGGAAYIEEQWRAKGRMKAAKKYGKKMAGIEAKNAGYKQAVTKIESKKETERYEKSEQRKAKTKRIAKKTAKTAAKAPVVVIKKTGKGAKKAAAKLYEVGKNAYNKTRDARATRAYRVKRKSKKYPHMYSLNSGEYRIT